MDFGVLIEFTPSEYYGCHCRQCFTMIFWEFIELINIFRKPEFVEDILEEVIEMKKKYGKIHTVWMQLGIFYDKADTVSKENQLNIITNKCIKIEHGRLQN